MNIPQASLSGVHIFGELDGIDFSLLNDLKFLESSLIKALISGGVTVCGHVSKQFSPHGVTTLVLLSESHASIHTYPEEGFLFFDLFTCGAIDPEAVLEPLVAMLRPEKVRKSKVFRGR